MRTITVVLFTALATLFVTNPSQASVSDLTRAEIKAAAVEAAAQPEVVIDRLKEAGIRFVSRNRTPTCTSFSVELDYRGVKHTVEVSADGVPSEEPVGGPIFPPWR